MERLINFDPQWINDVVITGINIFILFFAMSYLLFNPARDYLEKRRKKIAGDLETAKSSRESALALQAEYEEKLRSIDKEAEAILDEARKKAKKQEAEEEKEDRRRPGDGKVQPGDRPGEEEGPGGCEDRDRIHRIPDGRKSRGSVHGCEDPGFPDPGDFKGNG